MSSGIIELTPGVVLGPDEPITAGKLNNLGLPTIRVAEQSVGARELADGSIGKEKLDPNLEGQLGVPDNSITTSKIVDGAVTGLKVAIGASFRKPFISPLTGLSYRPSVLLASFPTLVNNPTPTEQTAWSLTIPANFLARPGDALRIMSTTAPTGTGSATRTFRYKFGGVVMLAVANTTQNNYQQVCLVLYVVSINSQRVIGGQQGAGGGCDAINTALTLNLALAQVLALTMIGSSATGVATQFLSTVEYLPAPS